jgi:hypothetical protein
MILRVLLVSERNLKWAGRKTVRAITANIRLAGTDAHAAKRKIDHQVRSRIEPSVCHPSYDIPSRC